MSQLGRISGPLLEANLLRKGLVGGASEDLSFETDLLYLDVTNGRIGIKTSSPTVELEVDDTIKTNFLLVDTLITVPDIEIKSSGNEIKSLFSTLKFEDAVYSEHIRAADVDINENVISTVTPNTNLELRPDGNGTLEVYNDFNVHGNLFTPNDITLGGKLIFGNSDTDNVTFAADIINDILPSATETYSFGRNNRFWKETYAANAIGEIVYAGGLSLGDGVNPALSVGNIWYVAENGLDTNVGTHQQGPYKTVKKALQSATAGDTVFIFPGTYEEDLPLTIPAGVSVQGADLRNTIITPDTDTQSNDVFLLNGETTVSDLTIKNFYYDSVNDTGYAFRFAPNFKVISRSPYVQNCSVITHGSTTSPTDPLGFDSADAGRGALVDGSEADPTSKEASMLFHSMTMITPGVDAILMTNGVRVEWLNSFTYFANRGLYATNGSLGFASLGTKYGAEIRSIGSANVYGNYGAVADGNATLMYLIQHNFGYIGSGKNSENDQSLHIQANETQELNSGKIYYQSMDHQGDFRVGDTFNVSFQTGLASINGVSVNLNGPTAINFGSPTSETNIDATQVNTGNIRFSGNTINSLSGPVNLTAFTGNIFLDQNVAVSKDLEVAGDLTISGQLILGNQTGDTVDFNAPVQYDLRPTTTRTYDLGSNSLNWKTVYVNDSYVSDTVYIHDNKIETITSNADLELKADGTGKVVSNANVEITQDLSLGLTSNILDTNINGTITDIGSIDRSGSTGQTGNINLTGDLTVSVNAQYTNVRIENNVLSTTDSNSDLELVANGTGIVQTQTSNVEIDRDLSANLGSMSAVNADQTVTANELNNGNISIDGNIITTTTLNSDLELKASGTGSVVVPQDDVKVNNDLDVLDVTDIDDIQITGTVDHTGNKTQTGNVDQTGDLDIFGNLTVGNDAFFENVNIVNNTISTSDSNSDLELRAAGTGRVVIPNNDVELTGTLTVDSIFSPRMVITTRITTDQFLYGNILIDDNVITTTLSNSDLQLRAAGTGDITVLNNDVRFGQTLTVQNLTTLANTNVNGQLTHTGTVNQTGNTTQTGSTVISNNLTVNSQAFFENISIVDNRISTTASNSDLELRAASTGIVKVSSDSVRFGQNLQVVGVAQTSSIGNTGTVTSDVFTTGDITLDNNQITTTVGNNNLILRAAGTGQVTVPNKNVVFGQNLTVSGTTNLRTTNITSTVQHTGNKTQTGNVTQTGNFSTTNFTTNNDFFFDNIVISDNRIYTSDSNSDLELRAAGTGRIYIPSDPVRVDQTLSIGGLTSTSSISNSSTITSNRFLTTNIEIDDNYITSLNNTNLVLTGAGSGGPRLEQLKFNTNILSTESGNTNIVLTPGSTSNLILNTTTALRLPVGTTANRVTGLSGDIRFNTDDGLFGGWSTARRTFGGVYSADRNTRVTAQPNTNVLAFVTGGAAAMEIYPDRLRANGLVVDSTLNFNSNVISNLNNNADIFLTSNGSAKVITNELSFEGSDIKNENLSMTDAISLASTNDGYVRFNTTTALKVPIGDTASRPLNPELGDFRFNTDEQAAEVYNGTQYVPITGTGDIATQEIVEELGDVWVLILG